MAASLPSRTGSRAWRTRIDRRLDAIEAGLKEFYRMLAELDKRMSRLEEKQYMRTIYITIERDRSTEFQ
jgi:hypothetical protein